MASASCDLAEVLVISLCVDQWSAVCGHLPFFKWPMDTSVTHDTNIIEILTLSYANKVSSEGPTLVSMEAVPCLVITYSK